MASVDEFKEKLKTDHAARAKFLADVKHVLKQHGVNVDDPAVKQKFEDDAAFKKALASSGWAVSVVSG